MKKIIYYKIKPIKIKDVTLMSLMLALYIVLNASTSFSLNVLFMSINVKLIPVFILAMYTDWLRTLIVAIMGGAVGYFLPTNADVGVPLAYVFDYYIPVLLITICSLFLPRNYVKKSIEKNKSGWFYSFLYGLKVFFFWLWTQKVFILILLIFTIFTYISKVIGGVLFWSDGKPEGENVWVWSMIFNIPNSGGNFFVFVATIPAVCYTLQPYKNRIY